MEDIIDIIVTETTNLIEITSQPTDEIIDVNIIDNREDVTLNVTPTLVEININSLTGNFGVNWGEIAGTLSNQTDLQNALNLKADLVDGKVPSSQLPSYVDDVVEVANYAALPVTGEVGKIYITLDTNYIYRWTGSTYVEIKDSSAVWGAITGTLSNQTDLQNALNAKANDNAVVHLAGTETITGAKTFSSAVIAPNFVLSGGTGNTGLYYGHTDRVVLANYTTGGIDFEVNGGSIVATLFPSGNYGLGITLDAGYKLDVNGTTRISGALSGTSASFSSSVTASSFVKTSGTSSQFLKADGSVDSTSYLALSGGTMTGNLYLPANNTVGGTNYFIGQVMATSDVWKIYGSSAEGDKGELVFDLGDNGGPFDTGGQRFRFFYSAGADGIAKSVLTIDYNASTFLTTLAANSFIKIGGTSSEFLKADGSVDSSTYLTTSTASSSYLPLSGGTLTGALSGTSATFSGRITANHSSAGDYAAVFYNTSTTGEGVTIRGGSTASHNALIVQPYNGASTLFSVASTGAATFSSSVTATGGLTIGSLGSGSDAIISLANNASGSPRTIYYKASTATINFTSTGGGDLVTITNGGNVGIGTTLPGNPLTVSSTIGYATEFYRNNNADSRINITNTTTTTGGDKGLMLGEIGVDSYFYNYATGAAIFGTSSTERMRITSSGLVGINTTTPFNFGSGSGMLDVRSQSVGAVSGVFVSNSDASARLTMYINNGTTATIGTSTNHAVQFVTQDVERMRITSGGDVCIASTAPISTRRELRIGGNAVGSRISLGLNGTNYSALVTDSGGNVYLANEFNDSAIKLLMINYNNGVYLSQSATSWTSNSDERLKTDLVAIENATEKVASLRSVIGRYKTDDESKRRPFLIAQDVYSVLPEAVDIDKKTGMMGVQYTEVIPLLVASIKELKSELDLIKQK